MLKLDISNLFLAKNIKRGYSRILRFGMSPITANKYVTGKATHIKLDHIHRLCELIHCTPNELFTYQPKDEAAASGHPLAGLRRPGGIPRQVLFELWSIPPDKAEKAEEMMNKLLNE